MNKAAGNTLEHVFLWAYISISRGGLACGTHICQTLPTTSRSFAMYGSPNYFTFSPTVVLCLFKIVVILVGVKCYFGFVNIS